MSEPVKPAITERALHRWKLVTDFQQRLAQVWSADQAHRSWSDPARQLQAEDYLSLFLFGLFNPVVRTLRGLSSASKLDRVQQDICSRPVSLGSFSEAQHLLEPALLQEMFASLSQEVGAGQAKTLAEKRRWLIQDSSLFDALPRMYWAFWRRQGKAQSQVRLHLSLDLNSDSPARASITPGKTCERAAWRAQCRRGDGYIGDRYYGQDYQLLGELEEAGVAFVVRLREEAVINVEEELPLTDADRQAKVTRSARATLGGKDYRSIPLRVVWVQAEKEVLVLVTNLGAEELSAGQVALLYKQRWQIELFFRWIKCILGCRHWLAESPEGAALQIYLALIAALLLQLYTGERPNRRMMELLQFYLLGVATLDEVEREMKRERERKTRPKKS